RSARLGCHRANLYVQPILLDRQVEVKRSGTSGGWREMVLLQEVEDRDRSLVLDIRAAADDRVLVEGDAGDPPIALGVAHRRRITLRTAGRAGSTTTAR